MADYLSYEQYQELGGTLNETRFEELAFEATSEIDWYTFDRLENFEIIPEEVQRCMFYLIKLLKEQSDALMPDFVATTENTGIDKTIASQSNDGVSISYNVLSASESAEQAKQKTESVISKYLGNVKDSLGRRILYRGLYPDE